MDSPLPILSLSAAALAGAAAAFPKIQARVALSRAKHRSLAGHSKMSKLVARLVPHYEFDVGSPPTARRRTSRRSARTASSVSRASMPPATPRAGR
jgi:kynureninase